MAANVLLNHPPDARTYGVANAILKDLQLSNIVLLTNNPDKIEQLEAYGSIKVVERRPMVPRSWSSTPNHLFQTPSSSPAPGSPQIGKELDKYLAVKVKKMRHLLELPQSLDKSL